MISIFNRTATPWSVETLNENTCRLTTTREISKKDRNGKINKRTRYVSIPFAASITNNADADITSYVEMTQPSTIATADTTITFGRKDCRPFINIGRGKFNNDILAMSIPLNGSILVSAASATDNMKTAAKIINSSFTSGELHMIIAVNANDATPFVVKLHNNEKELDTIYTFTKNNSAFTVETAECTNVETAETTFRINQYRPLSPTYNVVCLDSDLQSAIDVLRNPDKHVVSTFTSESYSNIAERFASDRISAITLYAHAEDLRCNAYTCVDETQPDGFASYSQLVDTLKKDFRIVNVMTHDGKIYRK